MSTQTDGGGAGPSRRTMEVMGAGGMLAFAATGSVEMSTRTDRGGAGPSRRTVEVIDVDALPALQESVIDLTGPNSYALDDEVVFVSEKAPARKRKREESPKPPSPLKGIKCPVCLERKETDLCTPSCGHVLCGVCMKQILKSKRAKCPVCRKKITSKRILKLHA